MTVKQKIASISKSPYQYNELFYPEHDNVTVNYLNYPESSWIFLNENGNMIYHGVSLTMCLESNG